MFFYLLYKSYCEYGALVILCVYVNKTNDDPTVGLSNVMLHWLSEKNLYLKISNEKGLSSFILAFELQKGVDKIEFNMDTCVHNMFPLSVKKLDWINICFYHTSFLFWFSLHKPIMVSLKDIVCKVRLMKLVNQIHLRFTWPRLWP